MADEQTTDWTDADVEEDRQAQITDLLGRHEMTIEGLRLQYLNRWGAREALHTAFVFQEIVNNYLSAHPIVTLDPVAYRLAHGAASLLADLYQRIGCIEHDFSLPSAAEEAADMVERYLGTFLRWIKTQNPNSAVAANARCAAEKMVEAALAKPR